MSQRVIVSADDHLQEPPDLWRERLPARLRDQAPRLVDLPDGGQGFVVADQAPRALGILVMAGRDASEFTDKGLTWDDVPVGSYDPAGRLRDMERDGVSASVLYPNICLDMMMDQVRLSPELAREVYKVYNDHMSEFCSTAPDRLVGIGLLPMDTTEDAVEELERLATLPGIRGALIPYIPPGGRDWNDPYFEPFWAAANEVGMPLSVHSGRPRSLPLRAETMRMPGGGSIYMHIGPISMAETLARIMWTGAFDRYPKLKLVSVEGGIGWLGFFIERGEHVRKRHSAWTGVHLESGPRDWFGRNLFATFEEDVTGLHDLDLIGAESVMWASDYPHSDTTWPNSMATIDRVFAGVDAAARDKITRANAAKLYGLDL